MAQDPRNIFVDQRTQYENPTPQKGATQNPNAQSGSGATQTQQEQTNKTYQQKVDEMKRLAVKYQREGEGQLVKDILNSVIEQKAKGQLSNDQLIAFAKRISPLLNTDQRQRLNELLEQLLKL